MRENAGNDRSSTQGRPHLNILLVAALFAFPEDAARKLIDYSKCLPKTNKPPEEYDLPSERYSGSQIRPQDLSASEIALLARIVAGIAAKSSDDDLERVIGALMTFRTTSSHYQQEFAYIRGLAFEDFTCQHVKERIQRLGLPALGKFQVSGCLAADRLPDELQSDSPTFGVRG